MRGARRESMFACRWCHLLAVQPCGRLLCYAPFRCRLGLAVGKQKVDNDPNKLRRLPSVFYQQLFDGTTEGYKNADQSMVKRLAGGDKIILTHTETPSDGWARHPSSRL